MWKYLCDTMLGSTYSFKHCIHHSLYVTMFERQQSHSESEQGTHREEEEEEEEERDGPKSFAGGARCMGWYALTAP